MIGCTSEKTTNTGMTSVPSVEKLEVHQKINLLWKTMMMETKETTFKVVSEGHYKTPDEKEGYSKPIGSKHMFSKVTNAEGKWWPHSDVATIKSCVNQAMRSALMEIENGGYMTIEVKVVNP